MKTGFVSIIKKKSTMGIPHPNNIEEGYQNKGQMNDLPTVGKRFLINRVGGYLETSLVTEIIEEKEDSMTFSTENSIYVITSLNSD